VFNPTETAENLKKHGGFIPGIRPGEGTEHIDHVLSRITAIGAVYLALVCHPGDADSYAAVPFIWRHSLLIVVSVTMDTVAQIQGHRSRINTKD
jgi:preprotein translocase subunit SecY